jgi:hypothetical protein
MKLLLAFLDEVIFYAFQMRQSRSASINGKRPGIESRKLGKGDGEAAGSADLKINLITKVLHAIRRVKQNSILWYAKNVKYRAETILMLFATLLLYFSCSGILITRRFFVFSNSLYLLTFKLFVIGTGFLMFFTFLDIAERKRCFEFIKDMHQSGKSLPEILDFTRVNRSSKTVKFIGNESLYRFCLGYS